MNRNKTKLIALFSIMGALLLGAGVTLAPKGAVKTEAATETFTITLTGKSLGSGTKYVETETTATNYNGGGTATASIAWNNINPSTGQLRGNQTTQSNLQSGKNFYVRNSTALPGNIRSVTINYTSTASTFVAASIYTATGSSQISSQSTGGSTAGTSATGKVTWTFTGESGKYFAIGCIKGGTSGTALGQTVVVTYEVVSSSVVTALTVSPTSKSLLTSLALVAADYTVSVTKDGGAGSSADYTAKIGTGSGASFSGSDITWGTTTPKVTDTTIQFKAKYPSTAGGSTFLTADVALNVSVPAATSVGVTAAGGATTIVINETLQLSAVVLPVGSNQSVTWSSSNNSLATVNSSTGLVTGVAVGDVIITATSTTPGISGTISLSVEAIPHYATGFESSQSFTSSSVYNSDDVVFTGPTGKQWGTYFGTPSTTDAISGSQSMQMRWYTNSSNKIGYTYTNFDINGASKVDFKSSSTGGLNVSVSYSINSGSTWLGAELFTLSGTVTTYTYNIPVANQHQNLRFKFTISVPSSAPTSTSRVYVDDVAVSEPPPLVLVNSVTVSPKSGTIYSNGTNNKTIQLGASVLPENALYKDINWTTSSSSIVTVSSSGLVTAVGPGTATITATAKDASGKFDTATITVVAKAISGLSVSGTLVKDEYNIGETFDPTGLTFTAAYNNGDTSVVNHNQLTFNPAVFAGGETQVQVSYSGKSVTISNIVVSTVVLESLTSSGTLAKTNYFVGETFDPTGLTFTAHYSDESSENLSYGEITFVPSVMSLGTTQVVASYITESTTISGITVQSIVLNSISIKTQASKQAFKLGEAFSHTGLTINANYNNGTVVKSSGFSVTGVNTMKLGVQTATITFEGKTVTYEVSVTNVGADYGGYVTSPGVYNNLYTGSGNWSTASADLGMSGNSYGNYTEVKLSSTDSSSGKSWTISVGNNGSWGSFSTAGANIGSNSVAQYGNNVIPTAITQISNYSTMVSGKYPLYFGMNFDVSNASRFSVNLGTEKVLDAYVVYSTNGGVSYQILGAKQTTSTTTTTDIIAGGETSLGSNIRFGVLLVGTSSGVANRTRIGDIAVQSFTPGSTNWVNGDFSPLQQATAFSDYVMTGIGEGAEGKCAAVLEQLELEYNAMSDPAKTEFSTNASFAAARARMAYLTAWVAANSESGSAINITSSQSVYIVVIVSILGISTLAGYYFIRKRPKEEIN